MYTDLKVNEEIKENQIVEQLKKEEILDNLYNVLNSIKGQTILAENEPGFETYRVYECFDWHLFKTSNGTLKIVLENDLSYDTETPPIYFKIDDIDLDSIEIDGDLDKNELIENIWISLLNGDTLRLELQW